MKNRRPNSEFTLATINRFAPLRDGSLTEATATPATLSHLSDCLNAEDAGTDEADGEESSSSETDSDGASTIDFMEICGRMDKAMKDKNQLEYTKYWTEFIQWKFSHREKLENEGYNWDSDIENEKRTWTVMPPPSTP